MSRLAKFLAIIVLTFSLQTAIYAKAADQEITGKVTNKETGDPVAGATVTLLARDGRQLTLLTNNNGEFTFREVATATYLLKVEATGLSSRVLDNIRVTANDRPSLEIALESFGIHEEVIITANNSVQSVDELSKSITLIDRRQIETRQEYTLAETLRTEPGVRVRNFGGPGSLTSIRLRGLGNENTAILIDGLRVRDAGEVRGSSLSLNDSLFTDNTERVELLRGSGSSLYGTNAVGGVINIVPFTGAGRPSLEVGFEGGSLGFLRESARFSGSLKDQLSYSLAASRIDTNDGIDGRDVYRTTNLANSLRYAPITGFSVSGIINYSRSFLQTNDSPFPIGPAGNEFGFASPGPNGTLGAPIAGFIPDLDDPDAFRTIRFLQTGVAVRHRLSETFSYFGNFNYVRSNRRFVDGPAASPFLVDLITRTQGFFPQITSDARFQGQTYTFNGGANIRLSSSNLVSLGVEVEKERLRQQTDFFGRERFSQKTFGFYFQDQLSFFENRLQLSLAGRVQGFDLNTPSSLTLPSSDLAQLRRFDVPRAYTGDGSIAYNFLSTGTKIRAHVGNSFRAPSLSERFNAFDSNFQPVRIGNPFLRPERAISVDGGIDQKFRLLNLSLTYFYTRRQEIIAAGFVPFSNTSGAAFFQSNMPGGLARGLEASGQLSLATQTDLRISYLYVNSEQQLRGVRSNNQPFNGSTRALGIPRNTFSATINQRYRKFNFNFDLTTVSDYDNLVFTPAELFTGFASPIFRFDGYIKADLAITYTLRRNDRYTLEIFGKGINLTNDEFFEDGFRTPGALGTGGIKIRF